MDMETYCGNNQRSDCTAMTLAGGKEGKICTGDLSCMDDIEKVFKFYKEAMYVPEYIPKKQLSLYVFLYTQP